jgi:hypothetical protein
LISSGPERPIIQGDSFFFYSYVHTVFGSFLPLPLAPSKEILYKLWRSLLLAKQESIEHDDPAIQTPWGIL